LSDAITSQALTEKLGHQFKDLALLRRALTHAGADSQGSNERLEFLGDRVLGLVVAEKLYELFPDDEGELTRRLHALVRWESCAIAGEAAGLWDHLILTRSESRDGGGRSRGPLIGSACEAVIAALYLDGGMVAARAFIERYWRFDNFDVDMRDAKTRLQEWAQARGKDSAAPVYSLKERSGPDHAPSFVVEAQVSGFDPVCGEGGSKRQAEQDAATRLLAIVAPQETP
jgi:ribonuclease-3